MTDDIHQQTADEIERRKKAFAFAKEIMNDEGYKFAKFFRETFTNSDGSVLSIDVVKFYRDKAATQLLDERVVP